MKYFTLHGMNRETGDDVNVDHLAAENPSEAFAAAEKSFPDVWFFYCAPYQNEEE